VALFLISSQRFFKYSKSSLRSLSVADIAAVLITKLELSGTLNFDAIFDILFLSFGSDIFFDIPILPPGEFGWNTQNLPGKPINVVQVAPLLPLSSPES
jgi:hypothetical protein